MLSRQKVTLEPIQSSHCSRLVEHPRRYLFRRICVNNFASVRVFSHVHAFCRYIVEHKQRKSSLTPPCSDKASKRQRICEQQLDSRPYVSWRQLSSKFRTLPVRVLKARTQIVVSASIFMLYSYSNCGCALVIS